MSKKLTDNEFQKKIVSLVGNEYTFLEPYQGTKISLKVRHNCELCNNYEYKVTPNGFISGGNRCPHKLCYGKRMSEKQRELIKKKQQKGKMNPKKSNESFLKEVEEQVGNEYTFLEEYIKNNKPLRVRHNLCKHEYSVSPVAFLSNKRRCPQCSLSKRVSKGHKFIEKFLIYNSIIYKKEVKFDNCLSEKGKHLRFDFQIEYNGRNFLLEYDGHYHKTGWKGNPKSKEIVEKHDMIKNVFCLKNNIFLYRIQSDKETNKQKILNELNLMFGSSTTIENLNEDE